MCIMALWSVKKITNVIDVEFDTRLVRKALRAYLKKFILWPRFWYKNLMALLEILSVYVEKMPDKNQVFEQHNMCSPLDGGVQTPPLHHTNSAHCYI